MFVFYFSYELNFHDFFYCLAFAKGMPKFDLRTRMFIAPVRSNYRSYFKPECQPAKNANTDEKRPPSSYNRGSDESPEEETEYYNKARQQPRPYKQSKSTTFS